MLIRYPERACVMAKSKRQRDGTWEEPAELRKLREQFTDEKARAAFEKSRGYPPKSEEQLAVFVEWYTLELYNGGFDEP